MRDRLGTSCYSVAEMHLASSDLSERGEELIFVVGEAAILESGLAWRLTSWSSTHIFFDMLCSTHLSG
jgi:hypothetical protein